MTELSNPAFDSPARHDPTHPTYHFAPSKNWMNDPNGVIQWKGQYHLFYQYNPFGAYHDHMHWGHAVSDDLIRWRELNIALAPDAGTVDEGGIFSGCIVDNDGVPTAFYTGVNMGATVQRQCMAVGDDALMVWRKYAGNPVIAAPPANARQDTDFRDPFVWREDEYWYMALGSRIEGVGGAVFLYRSINLVDWQYLNPLLVGDTARHGTMWECPNFFSLGDKWVLIVSSHTGYATGNVFYFVGAYRDRRFYPEYEALLDSGQYYATLTQLDDQKRRLMWGWIRETRSAEQQLAAGWSGVQAVPRVLSLDKHNRLLMSPVGELDQLRTTLLVTRDDLPSLPVKLPGLALDVAVEFRIQGEQPCGIVVQDEQGELLVSITYDPVLETLDVRHNPSANSDASHLHGKTHRLSEREPLTLRILFDGSVVEVIANGRTSITRRIYPTQVNALQLDVLEPGSITAIEVWEMSSIR